MVYGREIYIYISILDISIIVLFFPDLFSPKDPKTFGWEGNHLNVSNLPLPSWIGASNKNTGKISLVILAPLAFRKMLVSFSFQPKYKGEKGQQSDNLVEFLLNSCSSHPNEINSRIICGGFHINCYLWCGCCCSNLPRTAQE